MCSDDNQLSVQLPLSLSLRFELLEQMRNPRAPIHLAKPESSELGLGLGLGFVLEAVHQQRVPVALRTDNSPLQKTALMHACFGGLGNEPSESGR